MLLAADGVVIGYADLNNKYYINTVVSQVTQVYLPNSDRFVDDMMPILYSYLGGRIDNEKLWFQLLAVNSFSQTFFRIESFRNQNKQSEISELLSLILTSKRIFYDWKF